MATFNLPLRSAGFFKDVAAVKVIWGNRESHPEDGAMFRVTTKGVQESPKTTLKIQQRVNAVLRAAGVWATGVAPVVVAYADDDGEKGLRVDVCTVCDADGNPIRAKRREPETCAAC